MELMKTEMREGYQERADRALEQSTCPGDGEGRAKTKGQA